jgi:hypothetical protein
MGFFSWDCKGCGHPMLSRHATNKINEWMNDVVVLEKSGNAYMGKYDGYGRVGNAEIQTHGPCCWHKACWEKAGKPEYSEASEMSEDQGYFFGDEHDMKEPIP